MAAETKLMVEPLDVDNYATWSIRMRALLISKGLWATVESSNPDANDQKALAQLILHVKDHHLMTVGACTTAKQAWDKLKTTYEAKTNARKLLLRRELTQLNMGATEQLTMYVARAKDIQAQMMTAGDEVQDQEVAMQFLAGLPPAYSMISTVLVSSDRELKIDEMLPKLLPVEQMSQPERPGEAALYAKPGRGSGKYNHGGHSHGAYPSKKKETRECYYCGKPGHLQKDCFKKTQGEARQRGNPGNGQRPNYGAIALTANQESSSTTNNDKSLRWVLDTGASRHITSDGSILRDHRPLSEPIIITFGNGGQGKATTTGEVMLRTSDALFILTEVLYIPEATENLISVRHATKNGLEFKFCEDRCEIGQCGRIVATAPCYGDAIYYLTGDSPQATALVARRHKETPQLWHQRFGHLSYDNLARLPSMVTGINITAEEFKTAGTQGELCEPCAMGKQHRSPFKLSNTTAARPLELVHTDVCGPLPITSLGGSNYFLTLLDDHSKLSMVQPIARKSDAATAVQSALNMLENQIDLRTKRLRCDNGSEYINAALKAYCDSKGIKLETTVRYTPEQNGAAERLNRTLMDKVRPMLNGAGLPKYLWAEAVVTANYVRNRSPVSGRDKTPWELFFGIKPDVSHLRTFGIHVYALTPKELRNKLEPTSERGRFIGYPAGTKGYKILLDTGRIIISRDVRFVEFGNAKQTPTAQFEVDYTSEEEDHDTEFADEDMKPDNPPAPPAPPGAGPSSHGGSSTASKRPKRTVTDIPATIWRDEGYMISGRKRNLAGSAYMATIKEPTTVEEALASDEAEQWKHAMDDEMTSLLANKTWTLEYPPTDITPIPVKWVFKIKRDSAGKLERYKARLVAKGFKQQEGVNQV